MDEDWWACYVLATLKTTWGRHPSNLPGKYGDYLTRNSRISKGEQNTQLEDIKGNFTLDVLDQEENRRGGKPDWSRRKQSSNTGAGDETCAQSSSPTRWRTYGPGGARRDNIRMYNVTENEEGRFCGETQRKPGQSTRHWAAHRALTSKPASTERLRSMVITFHTTKQNSA